MDADRRSATEPHHRQPVQVSYRARKVPGRHGAVPVRDYLPEVVRDDAEVVVWIHGGGFVGGNLRMPESHAVAEALAATGRPVVALDYRKVSALPLLLKGRVRRHRHNYPVAVHDVLDAYEDVARRWEGRRLVVGGASAGAELTASLASRELSVRPDGLMLAYGAFHAEMPPHSPALAERLRRPDAAGAFTPEVFRRMVLNYVGSEEAATDPDAFPGTASVENFPPTLFVDADADALRASSEAFADRLRAHETPVERHIVEATKHGFLNEPRSPGFVEGIALMSRWLDRLPG